MCGLGVSRCRLRELLGGLDRLRRRLGLRWRLWCGLDRLSGGRGGLARVHAVASLADAISFTLRVFGALALGSQTGECDERKHADR